MSTPKTPAMNPPLPSSGTPEGPVSGADPKLVIAVAKITMNDPTADLIHTGSYGENGTAILRKVSLTIMPGEFFEMADAVERASLLKMEAIRYPTETELLLRKQEVR